MYLLSEHFTLNLKHSAYLFHLYFSISVFINNEKCFEGVKSFWQHAEKYNFCSFLIQYYLILQVKVILRRLATNFPHFFFSDPQNLPRFRLSLYFFICLSPSTFSPRVGSGSDHARGTLQKTGRTNAEQSESCDVDGGEERGRGRLEDEELITERGREKKWDTRGGDEREKTGGRYEER